MLLVHRRREGETRGNVQGKRDDDGNDSDESDGKCEDQYQYDVEDDEEQEEEAEEDDDCEIAAEGLDVDISDAEAAQLQGTTTTATTTAYAASVGGKKKQRNFGDDDDFEDTGKSKKKKRKESTSDDKMERTTVDGIKVEYGAGADSVSRTGTRSSKNKPVVRSTDDCPENNADGGKRTRGGTVKGDSARESHGDEKVNDLRLPGCKCLVFAQHR